MMEDSTRKAPSAETSKTFWSRLKEFLNWNKLQVRLTLLIVIIVVPFSLLPFLYVSSWTRDLSTESAAQYLEQSNESLYNSASRWMDMNLNALQQMVSLSDIQSMEAAAQVPILDLMATTYPHMYLVSTTDLTGVNVARSDDEELTDYSDRSWFQEAVAGEPVAFQTLIGRTSGEPTLVAAMPIHDAADTIVGVGMFAADLTVIADEIGATRVGETGFAYLVNESGLVLAHPDSSLSQELVDYSAYYPVSRVLDGYNGWLEFTDDSGTEWQGYVRQLDQGWGLVVQQETAEIFQSFTSFQNLSRVARILVLGGIVILIWYATGRTLRPVGAMTEIAAAVSQGDFSHTVPYEGDDELGKLARAFNLMVRQINDFVGRLEDRVAVRTRTLQTSTELGRRLSTLLDSDQLVSAVVDQIQKELHYYYVQLYLLDDSGENLTVAGGTGEAGQVLYAKKHQVPVGKGLVGHAAAGNRHILVNDVARIGTWLSNPLLPDTQAELAVPIAAGDTVLGVLDVQQDRKDVFTDDDVALLESVASSVAIAIQNSRLYEQARTQAEHEAQLNRINQQLLGATNMERMLQVAARELGESLGARRTTVQLSRFAKQNGRNQEKS